MNFKFLTLLGVVVHLSLVCSVPECNELRTCGKCIRYALQRCVWCAQNNMSSTLPEKLSARCQSRTEIYKDGKLNSGWCPLNEINDPDSKMPVVVVNEPFSAEKGKEVQFRPQKVQLTLRPGVPATFEMFYQPAKDYPLDMYFVMDNSYTMKNYAEKLATETLEIYEALIKMTNNVRFGIGTFVEKPALPYADPSILNSYTFKHHLSLTDNMSLFEQEVKSYYHVWGSNYDSPESGLDALMQVLKCGHRIGWRDPSSTGVQSRKIIILATDATYHSAGDGKMVGAYKPNDMKCHLDSDNKYDEEVSKVLDYPSVSQINHAAKQNKVNIVFAVVKNVLDIYKALAAQIFGADYVELSGDEIKTIIKNAYLTASREVKLQIKPQISSIKIQTTCDDHPEQCISTQENPIVHMKATITALNCSDVPDIEINPFGLRDSLKIQLKISCECECERVIADLSPECNSAGVKQCGICKCDRDRSGDTCETKCSEKDSLENMNLCKKDPNDVAYCNDNGDCVCGKCQCYNKDISFSGKFCEFNDTLCRENCPSDRGACKLGKCICEDYSQWSGPTCSCPVSDGRCIGPFSPKACSGRGDCTCGECECKTTDGKDYFGKYCQSCNDCAIELCEQLKEYANCNYEKNAKEDCDTRFNQTSVDKVIMMNKTALEADMTATGCRKELANGDIIVYKYRLVMDNVTETDKLELLIQDELEAPPVPDYWIVIGSVIGGALLIGLLTFIVWKLLTNMYDKREFDKFCKEAETAGFDVTNPVYLDPTVNFVNPAYVESTSS